MSKFVILGAAALALSLASPAFAKDLTPVGTNGWGGAFVGIQGGYAKENRTGCGDFGANINVGGFVVNVLPDPGPIDSCAGAGSLTYNYDQSGELFGVDVGYNWTPSELFLVGLQLDASLSNITGEIDPNNPFGGTATVNSLVTATAKAGLTTGRFLLYGEAGAALENVKFDGNAQCDFSMGHTGPVAGVGVSYKLSDVASLDVKYDHIWLGAQDSSCTSQLLNIDTPPISVNVPTELRTEGAADVIKVGLNFALGGK